MLEFKLVDVAEVPYFYQERSCGMAPEEVNAAMGGTFQAVWDFLARDGAKFLPDSVPGKSAGRKTNGRRARKSG